MVTEYGNDRMYENVISFIDENMKFEPKSYNRSYLERRIQSRIRRVGVDTYSDYLKYLKSNDKEQAELIDTLSVNVTEFFRNVEVWEEMKHILRDETANKRNVSCWSAACSDGREPYSIAMLSHDDPKINERRVNITATDIDEESLEKARNGVYNSSRITDIAAQLETLSDIEKYIDTSGDEKQFAVKNYIKRVVDFEKHDLISGQSKSGFDIVLCRNLLIYINTQYKEKMFDTLTKSIDSGGYLIIGRSETLPTSYTDMYEIYDRKNHIYKKK